MGSNWRRVIARELAVAGFRSESCPQPAAGGFCYVSPEANIWRNADASHVWQSNAMRRSMPHGMRGIHAVWEQYGAA